MKLTDWEVGQELIRISDCMGEVVGELFEADRVELAQKIQKLRAVIGDEFNKNNQESHGFMLFNSTNLKTK